MTISGRDYRPTATHYAFFCSVDWPRVPEAMIRTGRSRLERRHGMARRCDAKRDLQKVSKTSLLCDHCKEEEGIALLYSN